MRPHRLFATLAAGAGLLAACSSLPPAADIDRIAAEAIRSSFSDRGIAKVDRIRQDLAQAACSSETPPDEATAARLRAEALASVRWPADGRYLGDFREGERIAQSGRGMTWTDSSTAPSANGGNCYNCHQISRAEISFGTVGPSLHHYGRNRGITSLDGPAVQPVFEYTWTKLWNARATNACSQMPRFGHMGLLDQDQIRHLMALLLDPKSPVNQP